MNGAEQFESETGDANWPDETADRAVLDLAAVRETAGIDTAADADTQGEPATEPTVAGFTPIFSRRATGPATRDASPAADAEAATEEPAPPAPSQPESAGGSPVDDLPATPGDEIADTGAVHDNTPVEPEAEDSAADGADMEPGMAGADTVAFSSVRDTVTEPLAEVSSSDPGDVDAAPLLDDLPPPAATPDEGDSAASGARLTVLVARAIRSTPTPPTRRPRPPRRRPLRAPMIFDRSIRASSRRRFSAASWQKPCARNCRALWESGSPATSASWFGARSGWFWPSTSSTDGMTGGNPGCGPTSSGLK